MTIADPLQDGISRSEHVRGETAMREPGRQECPSCRKVHRFQRLRGAHTNQPCYVCPNTRETFEIAEDGLVIR